MLMMGIHEGQCAGLKQRSTSETELMFEEVKRPLIRPHISSSDSGPAKIANIINQEDEIDIANVTCEKWYDNVSIDLCRHQNKTNPIN